MADAAIVAWDANLPTVLAAHHRHPDAGTDGNAATVQDANWQPLLVTPNFPEYVCGHSTFSGAAAMVLANYFGRQLRLHRHLHQPCRTSSAVMTSFDAAAGEAGMSRIYGGIHFMTFEPRRAGDGPRGGSGRALRV